MSQTATTDHESPTTELPTMLLGDRVFFDDERLAFTVYAVDPDGRYVGLARPHFGAWMYTLVDRDTGWRGPMNTVGRGPFSDITDVATAQVALGECIDALHGRGRFEANYWELSHRARVRLQVREVRAGETTVRADELREEHRGRTVGFTHAEVEHQARLLETSTLADGRVAVTTSVRGGRQTSFVHGDTPVLVKAVR